MLGDKESGLKLYSLGIVVNDKPRNTDIIDIYPVEEMPFINGKVKDYKQKNNGSVVDSSGISKNYSIDLGAVIQAKWIPYGHSNRSSSPDVIKNETVLVFRFGETNKFYWTTVFNEPSIRRLETVVHRYGATGNYGVTLDDSNSYTLIISAHDKFIRLTTSKTNGEVVKYELLLDLNRGIIKLEDDKQNSIIIDSINGVMTTAIREKVIINTKEFVVNAGSITLNGGSTKFTGNNLNVNYTTTVFNGNSLHIGTLNFSASAKVSKLNASKAECC